MDRTLDIGHWAMTGAGLSSSLADIAEDIESLNARLASAAGTALGYLLPQPVRRAVSRRRLPEMTSTGTTIAQERASNALQRSGPSISNHNPTIL